MIDADRVLVTGGAGFIGSNVANRLAQTAEVIAIDDASLGTPANLSDNVTYLERDVCADGLPTDVDLVIHLAALSSYDMHEDDPTTGVRVNVEGFVNTVEQARNDGCDRIVYASTSSIYGSQTSPSPESMPITARTGYEASKLARERYAEYFGSHYDMRLAGLRFFSVYQGYGGAEGHKGTYANVIAQFADDIAQGTQPVLYGDGTQTRDFTHVDDVVRAICAAGKERLHGCYNVGTGEATSFNDLVSRINAHLDSTVSPRYIESPIPSSVYVEHTCADYTKLAQETGWEPTIDLSEGLRRVCAQYVRA